MATERSDGWFWRLARWCERVQGRGERPTRRRRRLSVLASMVIPIVYFALAVNVLYPWSFYGGGISGVSACFIALMGILIGMFLMRASRRQDAAVNLEDMAQMVYGRAFEDLTERQQGRLRFELRLVSGAWWRNDPDERQAAMQRDAESRAFGILRRGLPVLVAVYWAVCLSVPVGPVRLGLLFSAVAISGVVFVVLALPEVIRVWMIPDEVGEPKVVGMEREA
jgi:hypothetical protein